MNYWRRVKLIRATRPLILLRLNEAAGTTANDSSGNARHCSASNITWGYSGIDGYTAARSNGVNTAVNLYSASLNSAFSGAAGSVFIWAKNSGNWSDGNARFLFQIGSLSGDVIVLYSSGGGHLGYQYYAGGVSLTRSQASPGAGWNAIGLTWDKNAGATGEVKAYFNGSQVSTTLTGLGTWSGNLGAALCFLGGAGVYRWNGSIAHAAIWNVALTGAEMTTLADWTPTPDWVTPITDRAASDITNRTPKGFWNVADWTRVNGNSTHLDALILNLLERDPDLISLTPPTITTIPTATNINQLVENINRLAGEASLPSGVGVVDLVDDYTTGSAALAPDYNAVNAWENNQLLIRSSVLTVTDDLIRCGVGASGQARIWQHRFRG